MERITRHPPESDDPNGSSLSLSANETKGVAYSHQGHGPRADQTGRIHISDIRIPENSLLQTAAGPYIGSGADISAKTG
jgi:hypothetical protein